MTTATITTEPTSPTAGPGAPGVTARRVARGEWIKLRSVRSNVVTLLAGAAATVFFGFVFSISAGTEGAPSGPPGGESTDAVSAALGATALTQLIIGVVGVLVVAGEYATGLIRTTFAAVGSRLAVMRAKVVVVGVSVTALMAVATTVALAIGQAVYAGDGSTVGLLEPDTLRVLAGATLYLAGVAVIGVALGFILRSTAGAIGTLVAAFFIAPTLISLLPDSVTDVVLPVFPSQAGQSMMSLTATDDMLSTPVAFAVFALWVVGLLAVAAALVRRRDA